jgi:Immune inhibitor A-like, MAM domain
MIGPMMRRAIVRATAGVLALLVAACSGGDDASSSTTSSSGSGNASSTGGTNTGGSTDGGGGSGGESLGGGGSGGMAQGGGGGEPCAVDCASIVTPDCTEAVCNEGQYPGPIGECVAIVTADGVACEDGLFCTVNDACLSGQCVGGGINDCGSPPSTCEAVQCDEATASCGVVAANEGATCTPASLCAATGVCASGTCNEVPKDCSSTPTAACEAALCDPGTGMCVSQLDAGQDGQSCVDLNDLCAVSSTCSAGVCGGGSPKDCSPLNSGCLEGVCNATNGLCETQGAPQGTLCTNGIGVCEVGACDAAQACVASSVTDTTPCDDLDVCTSSDQCTAGSCGGTAIPMCLPPAYLLEDFEACPLAGWTLAAEWECGAPSLVGPVAAFSGSGLIGTDLDDLYDSLQSYATAYAQTPPIDLTSATAPVLAYQHWLDTEGSVYDGYHVEVSTDGGSNFSVITNVTPAYPLIIDGQPAYGGSALMWQPVTVDLSAYVGQSVILRLAFRSDGSVTQSGVYVDELQVIEADQLPVTIATMSVPDGSQDAAYSAPLSVGGGSGNGSWTIQGGSNVGWLAINGSTGELSGTPGGGDVGPVTVIVRYEDASNPANFDEVTYNFVVTGVVHSDDFEAPCPGTWILTGDWQCGPPSSGPGAAFSGTHVLATMLAGDYSNSQSWLATTASSSAINLAGTTAPSLQFKVWYSTEGSTFDGFNLKVSTDGVSYVLLATVTPAYPLLIAGESAWGGSQLAWTDYQADLSAYAGQTIYLQFGFSSDGSVTLPGVYIDDLAITD